MGWIQKILHKIIGRDNQHEDMVTVISSTPPSSPPLPPEKRTVDFSPPLLDFIRLLSENSDKILLLDPEEKDYYVYLIDDEGFIEIQHRNMEEWDDILLTLKDSNNKWTAIEDKEFICQVSLSLSNLGERISVGLAEPSASTDYIIESRKKLIRRVNKHKPATNLTHKNIEHLEEMIEKHRDFLKGELYDIMLRNDSIEKTVLEKIPPEERDYKHILKRNIPRKPIVESIAGWMGLEYIDVELIQVDKKTARWIPQPLAEEFNFIAFKKDESAVHVALGTPPSQEVLEKIRIYFPQPVRTYLSCEEDIRYELEKVFQPDD